MADHGGCNEACAHVIKHANGPDDAVFELRASIASGRVELAAAAWAAGRHPGRGDDGVTLGPHAGAQ
jgi:hypothetical protein